MRAPLNVMSYDDDGGVLNVIPSLAAIDILAGVKANETVVPAPITDEQTKIAAAKADAAANAANNAKIAPAPAPIMDEQAKTAAAKADAAANEANNAKILSAKPDPTKTAYADLTPAQRAAMTNAEKMDYMQAAREAQMAADAAARGATDPMKNYAVRPQAPTPKPGMINYYGWIGGVNSGEWRLYQAVDTPANQQKYGARSFGGPTQADATDAVGANALINQPVWDPTTNSWKAPTGNSTTGVTGVTGTGGDYTTVNGVLMYKGTPFSGNYNGSTYANGKITTNNTGNTSGYQTINGVLNFNGTPFTGSYGGSNYINGVKQGGANNSTLGANYSGSGIASDPFKVNGVAYTGSMFGSTYNNGVIVDMGIKTAEDIAKQGRLDARVEFGNTLKALGLPQDLIDEVDNMIKQDYTKSQMYLELKKTGAYKKRFPGMEALSAAGKAVDEGTYINMEKGYLQTLQYYGIDKNLFGSTTELGKYIGNLVSPKEFEDRVSIAAQDVEKNPDILAELNLYYGVDKSAAITYLLNPTIGLDIIKRQARAAEIGASAKKSSFDFGLTAGQAGYGVAESFINAAGTMDLQSLDVAFQQSRQLAANQGKLAQIEGADYNDLQAVSAILGKDQAAILDSQRRAAREAARFGGGSGLGSGSLKRETAI